MDSQYNSTGFGNEYNECNAYKCDNDGIKYQSKFYSKDEHVMEVYHILEKVGDLYIDQFEGLNIKGSYYVEYNALKQLQNTLRLCNNKNDIGLRYTLEISNRFDVKNQFEYYKLNNNKNNITNKHDELLLLKEELNNVRHKLLQYGQWHIIDKEIKNNNINTHYPLLSYEQTLNDNKIQSWSLSCGLILNVFYNKQQFKKCCNDTNSILNPFILYKNQSDKQYMSEPTARQQILCNKSKDRTKGYYKDTENDILPIFISMWNDCNQQYKIING